MTVTITPAEAEWLDWRRDGIGASDAAALAAHATGRASEWTPSPWSLWANKVGLVPDRPSSQRQRIGTLLEPVIAQLFHDETGLTVSGEQTWCKHPEHDWARCTVDGFVMDGDPPGVHECKTDARYGWDELPVPMRAQVVWQMGVTSMSHAWVSVLHGGFGFGVYEVPWDDAAEADWAFMLCVARPLWDCIEATRAGVLTPPPIDGSRATRDALAAVYPDHVPGTTAALDHLADQLAQRDRLKSLTKQATDEVEVIENMIRDALGEAEVGTVDGVPVLTYRTRTRAEHVVRSSSWRQFAKPTKADKEAAA